MTPHPLVSAARLLYKVHCFARPATRWARQSNGTWKSAGGRVLSDASYQKLQARVKKDGPGPAAPDKAPDKAATPAAKKHPLYGTAPLPGALAQKRQDRETLGALARAGPEAKRRALERLRAQKAAGAKPPTTADRPPLSAQVPSSLGGGPPGPLGPGGAGGDPSGAANRAAFERRKARGEVKDYLPDVDYTRPMGPGGRPTNPDGSPAAPNGSVPVPRSAAPPKPAPEPPEVPRGVPPVPKATPRQMADVDAVSANDQKRFGPRVANFLRSALAGAVAMLTAGNGAAWGALAGLALGGPLGLAIGTTLGGAAGLKLAVPAANKTHAVLGGRGRAAVTARKAARAVLPKAAALPLVGAGVVGSVGTSLALQAAGGAAAGVPGQIAGMALGVPAGVAAGQGALDMAAAAAKGTRSALARSPAARRRAARANASKLFAEAAPPTLDPVQLLKLRLKAVYARRGVPCPEAPDELVLAALAAAALADQQGKLGTAAPAPGVTRPGAAAGPGAPPQQGASDFSQSGAPDFVPNLQRKGSGLLPWA